MTTPSESKRDDLVDRLLASADYADYFAGKWSAILRNRRSDKNVRVTTYGFHDWIRESLYENKPYDQFVGEILSASGMIRRNPPVAWFHEDSGPGPPPEISENLFAPFVSDKPHGTGLGLSLAHDIVRRHQGSIRWERQNEHTVFVVELPELSP